MLVHIVCWKYRPETDDAARCEHRTSLAALDGLVDNMLGLEVGQDILRLERSFDTGLVIRFVDQAALDEYTVHPRHQEVAAMGRNIAERVVSVDFLV